MAHAPRNPLVPDRDGVSPSCIATPPGPWPRLLDFLAERLPALDRASWAQRMQTGWVWSDAAQPLAPDAPYTPHTRVYYWRHAEAEPALPWPARVLFQDAHLVVADKPHFMPVTPSGPFVQRSLLVQLKRELGLPQLSPIHRIDRDTAGLVVFAVQAAERAAYQALFRDRNVHKRYEAVAPWAELPPAAVAEPAAAAPRPGAAAAWRGQWTRLPQPLMPEAPAAGIPAAGIPATGVHAGEPTAWCYRSRLVQDPHFFTMHEAAGEANCETHLQLLARHGPWGRYALVPHTGRRHQLRAHLNALGLPIRHDPYYPRVSRRADDPDDVQHPLQLLAQALGFHDPVTGEDRHFTSGQSLTWPPIGT
ncbi:hypothetical protein CCO03_15480 [Comamonas serinivorans]|uniref:Pseudouridine synthase RsuA/RluA-like domain-containing protein n=1 Tax=Comamonas serinivorans TaxID=1082851 RepID=A0A1Y0EQW1_9BURK|nr:pseudouridine synthase [Comamonas serinivorans]ARU05888.1 hypothetical protein CCO03_15480 [Comamonas serinivorans]